MKYLLVLLVVGGAIWLWRHNRLEERSRTSPKKYNSPAQTSTTAMVVCRHCGIHLPQAEAIQGIQGYYCDPEHRRTIEG
ncbi:MAG TPA: PP0621 family protein [Macromonas sp.]|nr:PP0621 family protein [Macromonas sp.]